MPLAIPTRLSIAIIFRVIVVHVGLYFGYRGKDNIDFLEEQIFSGI
jgi:hypothetical protein